MLRSNQQSGMFVIEEMKLAEDYGSDPSTFDLFNMEYELTFGYQLNASMFSDQPPTYSTPIYTPAPQNNVQQPSITLNTQLIEDIFPSQPIAMEDPYLQVNDDNLNLQESEVMHQLDSTQNPEEREPIPITSPHPKITHFQMLPKDLLRNANGLTKKQSHKSLDDPRNLRKLSKISARQSKRFGVPKISAEQIRDLDRNKKNLTIQSGQVASYFYVEGADFKKNLMRYIYGKYFLWYGRNRYALDVLKNKKISKENRNIYYQTMSTFVQQVPHILTIFQNQNRPIGITVG